MDKSTPEPELLHPSPTLLTPERNESFTSNSSDKRTRKKKPMTGSPLDTLTAPNFETSDGNFDYVKKTPVKEDRFLAIFNRILKDLADGRAIHRKIKTNDFFKENHDLLEEELDVEGAIHLCRIMTLETFYENQQVYTKGQPTNDKVFLVYSGELEAFTTMEPPSYDFKQSNFNNKPSSRQGSPKIKGISIYAPPRPIRDGGYFGKESLENEAERTETSVVKSAQAQLLVFNAQDFEFVKQRYQKEMANKLNIAAKYFTPAQQKETDVKTKLFHSLKEKVLPLGEILIHEGNSSNFFYFLYEGKCELQKRLKPEAGGSESPSPRAKGVSLLQKQANICLLENGAFLGEEVLFQEDPVYQYSVRVTSARAIFFKFDKEDFQQVFGNPVVSLIEEKHNQKTGKNQEIFENISIQLHKRNNTKVLSPRFQDLQSPTHAYSINVSPLNRKSTFPSLSYDTEGPDFVWGSDTQPQEFSPTQRRLPQMLHSTMVPKESPRGTNGIVGFSSKGFGKNSIKLINNSSPTNRTFKGERLSLDDFSPLKKSKLGLVAESSLTARRHNDRLYTLETKETKNSLNLMDDIIKSARFESRNLPYINKITSDHSPGISDISEISPSRKRKNPRFFSDLMKLSLDLGPLALEEDKDKDKKPSAFFQQSQPRYRRGTNESLLTSPKETSPPPKSKSPQMKTPRIPLPLGQKIDLGGLKQQFFGTQKNGVKEYLATYKKAKIQNKMNRNMASSLQMTEGDCTVQMRLKPLPNFARKVSSPVISHDVLLQSKEILLKNIVLPKSGLSKLKGVGRKHVNLKPAQIDVKISRGNGNLGL